MMTETCVLVADAARARFFVLENSPHPRLRSSLALRELAGLRNVDHYPRDANGFSDTRTGANRTSGGPTHPYDDHRTRHQQEFNRRFAREAADYAREQARIHQARKLVVVASERMLGYLREAFDGTDDLSIDDIALDLTKHPPGEIQARLAARSLLPDVAAT